MNECWYVNSGLRNKGAASMVAVNIQVSFKKIHLEGKGKEWCLESYLGTDLFYEMFEPLYRQKEPIEREILEIWE